MSIRRITGAFFASALLALALGGYASADSHGEHEKGEETSPPVDTAPPTDDGDAGEGTDADADE
ncbi:MAG: hypothetical protein ACQGVK_25375 [Myxococcota bacterium]